MTYRQLIKDLGRMTADQLDSHVIVEVNDNFHNVTGTNIASGEGDYLYKDEVFFSIDSEPLAEKDFDEE
jgi:hypothetical protein